ncbi:MAG: MFS transporter, partial [Hyphomicrobiales bacterium]
YGWRAAYVGLGLIAVTAAAIMWWRLPHDLHGDRRTLRERLAVIGERGVPLALLTSALVTLATFVLMIYLAPIATTGMGLASTVVPMVLFAYGIGALVGNFMAGWTVDRLGARRTMTLFIAALVVLMALLPVVAMAPANLREGAFLAYILVFGGLTWGFFPAQLLRLASLAPKSVPLAASLNLTAGNVGGALAALLGGFAFERFGTAGVGISGAVLAAVALAVSLLVPDPHHQAPAS